MKATAVACALVALGGLAPAIASAETDVPSGGYDIRYSDGQSIAWQFTPCGPDCTVASSPGSSLVSNWRFQLAAGTWTYSGPHQIPCRDGSGALPVVLTYTFDAATLAGDSTATTTADGCGKPAGASNIQQFQLVRTG